ncbi:MAG: OadG family protein [Lentisphaeria bacterium]|nr:OadG family protein [Lentisphaeria bacterium]
MNNTELILAGIKLTVFGMGMVFSFLVLMICFMKGMSAVLKPFAAMFEPAPAAKPAAKPAASGNDAQLAAIAAAAVEMFRKK